VDSWSGCRRGGALLFNPDMRGSEGRIRRGAPHWRSWPRLTAQDQPATRTPQVNFDDVLTTGSPDTQVTVMVISVLADLKVTTALPPGPGATDFTR
jgi:hypothetical protein